MPNLGQLSRASNPGGNFAGETRHEMAPADRGPGWPGPSAPGI